MRRGLPTLLLACLLGAPSLAAAQAASVEDLMVRARDDVAEAARLQRLGQVGKASRLWEKAEATCFSILRIFSSREGDLCLALVHRGQGQSRSALSSLRSYRARGGVPDEEWIAWQDAQEGPPSAVLALGSATPQELSARLGSARLPVVLEVPANSRLGEWMVLGARVGSVCEYVDPPDAVERLLARAEAALREGREGDALNEVGYAEQSARCSSQPPDPAQLARVYGLRASAMLEANAEVEQTRSTVARALAIDRGYPLPSRLEELGDEIRPRLGSDAPLLLLGRGRTEGPRAWLDGWLLDRALVSVPRGEHLLHVEVAEGGARGVKLKLRPGDVVVLLDPAGEVGEVRRLPARALESLGAWVRGVDRSGRVDAESDLSVLERGGELWPLARGGGFPLSATALWSLGRAEVAEALVAAPDAAAQDSPASEPASVKRIRVVSEDALPPDSRTVRVDGGSRGPGEPGAAPPLRTLAAQGALSARQLADLESGRLGGTQALSLRALHHERRAEYKEHCAVVRQAFGRRQLRYHADWRIERAKCRLRNGNLDGAIEDARFAVAHVSDLPAETWRARVVAAAWVQALAARQAYTLNTRANAGMGDEALLDVEARAWRQLAEWAERVGDGPALAAARLELRDAEVLRAPPD